MDTEDVKKILDLKDLLVFSKNFEEKKKEEEENLPYHINVIDELHINENGHSRVLTKLLQYRDEQDKYVFLQSLLNLISDQKPEFGRIMIKNPNITQEKGRIDLWIRDDDYALIFENKVNLAADQETQIYRYIERTKEKKYEEEQIFVIYLSRDGDEPEEQTWGNNKSGYKNSFESRYVNLSFRYDILPWLKDMFGNLKDNPKENYLQSAILQYIDYLEGEKMFRTGKIYSKMNENLGKLVEDYYSLQNEPIESKIAKLLKEKKNVSDVKEQMESLTTKYFNEIYREWHNAIKQKYNLATKSLPKKWLIISVKINGFNVSIIGGTYDNVDSLFYCGVNPVPDDNKEVLKEKLGLSLYSEKDHSIFNSYSLDEYEKVYQFFEDLIEKVINLKAK